LQNRVRSCASNANRFLRATAARAIRVTASLFIIVGAFFYFSRFFFSPVISLHIVIEQARRIESRFGNAFLHRECQRDVEKHETGFLRVQKSRIRFPELADKASARAHVGFRRESEARVGNELNRSLRFSKKLSPHDDPKYGIRAS